ncbi:hypothetical protein [Streptomyces griseoloalbus]
MHPETYLALHHTRAVEHRAEADAYRRAASVRHPRPSAPASAGPS